MTLYQQSVSIKEIHSLTLLLLRLLSSNAQKKQNIMKIILTLSCWYSLGSSHWALLDEYPCARVSVIFQLFLFASFCIVKLSTSSIMVKILHNRIHAKFHFQFPICKTRQWCPKCANFITWIEYRAVPCSVTYLTLDVGYQSNWQELNKQING